VVQVNELIGNPTASSDQFRTASLPAGNIVDPSARSAHA
jgi:hypothetical protein